MSLLFSNLSSTVNVQVLNDFLSAYKYFSLKFCGTYAIVDFDNENDAKDAFEKLQGKVLNGQAVSIGWYSKHNDYSPAPKEGYYFPGKCFNCGHRGHIARFCPRIRKYEHNNYRSRSRSRSHSTHRRRRKRSYSDSSRSEHKRHHHKHHHKSKRKESSSSNSSDSKSDDKSKSEKSESSSYSKKSRRSNSSSESNRHHRRKRNSKKRSHSHSSESNSGSESSGKNYKKSEK
ncbi:MAG: RNA-binding protein [archaeon]|nr:RNA-binding protein [archaeon]